jgi:CRP-like cAMP-binding protein
VVRSCKTCKNGTRKCRGLLSPGDFFGWTGVKRSLSVEAAADMEVLFLKRSSLLSLATRDGRVASVLLNATIVAPHMSAFGG